MSKTISSDDSDVVILSGPPSSPNDKQTRKEVNSNPTTTSLINNNNNISQKSEQSSNTTTNTNSKQQEPIQKTDDQNQNLNISIIIPQSKESDYLSNISIKFDKQVFIFVIRILKENGLSGTRYYSDFIQEIGKTIVSIFYLLLPKEQKFKYKKYITEYISNPKMQILKTPIKELREESFISEIKGKEQMYMQIFYTIDMLFKVAIFISTEKLPDNYIFVPEMEVPIGWTPIVDYMLITSLFFYIKKSDFLNDSKLPFSSINKCIRPSLEWMKNRFKLIINETSKFVPDDFSVFEKNGSKKVFKKLNTIQKFMSINHHVVFQNQITIGEQKKLLRIFYLYGIPKKGGIIKIQNILRNNFINLDSIISFAKTIINRSIKYRPRLQELYEFFPNTNNMNETDHNQFKWIDERAIESISNNVEFLYRIRENYHFLYGSNNKNSNKNEDIFESFEIPEWKEILEEIPYWSIKEDKALFKCTAYYGFLFNSMLAKFIKPNEIQNEEIIQWREIESLKLTPILNDNSRTLFPIFEYERKKARLTQINEYIENIRNKNFNENKNE